MIRLYKTRNGELHYWAIWEIVGRKAIMHWGIVGHKGETSQIGPNWYTGVSYFIEQKAASKRKEGYYEILEGSMDLVVVQYEVSGWGSVEDIQKRQVIETYLNQLLGWRGLGHVDGSSIGSGQMELDCMVVDGPLAKTIIEQGLKEEGFADYSRVSCVAT